MLKRFISYYKPHKKLLALDLLASLLISGIGMVYPVITREMLNTYFPQRMYNAIIISGAVVLAAVFRPVLRAHHRCADAIPDAYGLIFPSAKAAFPVL